MPSLLQDNLSPVDLSNPVAAAHGLNYGRLAWWLCLPATMGGRQFFDLVGLSPGTLTSFSTAGCWHGPTRSGGMGELSAQGATTAYVDIPNTVTGPLSLTTNFTLSAWFKTTTVSGLQGLISKYHTSGDNAYYLRTNAATLEFGGASNIGSSGFTLTTNTWVHAACTFDGTTGRLYINGVQNNFGTGLSAWSGGTSGVQLGNDFTNGTRALAGSLDDCSIWNRALSAVEMLSLYRESLNGYPTTLNRVTDFFYAQGPLAANFFLYDMEG